MSHGTKGSAGIKATGKGNPQWNIAAHAQLAGIQKKLLELLALFLEAGWHGLQVIQRIQRLGSGASPRVKAKCPAGKR